jgi:hypothetical protein
MTEGLSDEVLRLRYADWCSAKIAERFLELSPGEIWERAQENARPGAPGGALPEFALPVVGSASYAELVGRASRAIARELGLPSFAAWAELYRADPSPYDSEIIGLTPADTGREPR